MIEAIDVSQINETNYLDEFNNKLIDLKNIAML